MAKLGDSGVSGAAMAAAMPPMQDTRGQQALEEQMRGMIGRLQKQADEQVTLRNATEQRWISSLRRYHGRYEPKVEAELKEQKKSRAFVRITRKKTNSWIGRLESLIFPTDDRNYSIGATPVPTLTKASKAVADQAMALVEQANKQSQAAGAAADQGDQAGAEAAMQEAGQVADQAHGINEQARQIAGEIKEAKKRADAMQQEMDDQLIECNYQAEGRDSIRDLCMIGTAIMKGPLTSESMSGSWQQQQDAPGQYVYSKSPDPRPVYRRVNPWAYFPDMTAMRKGEEEFEYERHLWTKNDLRKMVKQRGFNADAVRRLLSGGGESNRSLVTVGLSYLAELRELDGTTELLKGRYVGWEYHGPLEADEIITMLLATGDAEGAASFRDNQDPLVELRVICYFCDGELLKIAPEYPLDSQESLYSVVPFEPSDSSMFGYGIPDISESSQDSLNAAWRMVLDNMAMSTGPQVFIDQAMVEPANGEWTITPRKVWKKKAGALKGTAFDLIDIPNNTSGGMAIVEASRRFMDDETALPVQSEGEAVENPNVTATATNVMSLGQNVTFRSVVKAWDDGMTVPNMRRGYHWNMQFSTREDIKGDMSVDARGTSVLLARELQSQALGIITGAHLANPTLAAMLKPYQTYRQYLSSLMISPDDIMVTEDEYNEALKRQAESQQEPPEITIAKLQMQAKQEELKARLQIAQMSQQTAMVQFATQRDMTTAELNTELEKLRIGTGSTERMFAAELGADKEEAERAHAAGLVPTGSGGNFSFGEKKPEAVQ